METTIQRLTDELRESKSVTEDRQGQINELDTQTRVHEERMALKEKEMRALIGGKAGLIAQLGKL